MLTSRTSRLFALGGWPQLTIKIFVGWLINQAVLQNQYSSAIWCQVTMIWSVLKLDFIHVFIVTDLNNISALMLWKIEDTTPLPNILDITVPRLFPSLSKHNDFTVWRRHLPPETRQMCHSLNEIWRQVIQFQLRGVSCWWSVLLDFYVCSPLNPVCTHHVSVIVTRHVVL